MTLCWVSACCRCGEPESRRCLAALKLTRFSLSSGEAPSNTQSALPQRFMQATSGPALGRAAFCGSPGISKPAAKLMRLPDMADESYGAQRFLFAAGRNENETEMASAFFGKQNIVGALFAALLRPIILDGYIHTYIYIYIALYIYIKVCVYGCLYAKRTNKLCCIDLCHFSETQCRKLDIEGTQAKMFHLPLPLGYSRESGYILLSNKLPFVITSIASVDRTIALSTSTLFS